VREGKWSQRRSEGGQIELGKGEGDMESGKVRSWERVGGDKINGEKWSQGMRVRERVSKEDKIMESGKE
jgi:hypothetical protein